MSYDRVVSAWLEYAKGIEDFEEQYSPEVRTAMLWAFAAGWKAHEDSIKEEQ